MQNTAVSEFVEVPQLRVAAESLFRQKTIFVSLCVVIMVGVVALSILPKQRYLSETKFLIENNRANAVITPDRNSTSPVEEVSEEEINSELDVLNSDDVIGAVADPGWKSTPLSKRSGDALKQHEELLKNFRKHLKIEPGKKSNIITVTYTDISSEAATRTLGQFSNAYLAHRKTLARPSGTADFFASEANLYKDAWKKAGDDLSTFQQQHDVYAVPDYAGLLSRSLLSNKDDYLTNKSQIAEFEGRANAGHNALNSTQERRTTTLKDSAGQNGSEILRQMLAGLQNRRTELLTRYQPNDRQIREVDSEIRNTNIQLDELLAQKGHEESSEVNPDWQMLQSGTLEAKVESHALNSKSQALSNNIGSLSSNLKELESLELPYGILQEANDQARANYELYSEKREQALIEDAMDEKKILNVGVAETPTSTYKPDFPKPLLFIALGILSSLFLASGAVYFLEIVRSTFATPNELESFSSYSVLATIPEMQSL